MRIAEFYGIGDFLLGGRFARQIPVFACAEDERDASVISANFNISVSVGLDLNIRDIPNADIIYIGQIKQKGRLLEVIKAIAPRALIMEKAIAENIDLPGFKRQSETYQAREFCLPQKAKKTFVILWNEKIRPGDYFPFPDGLQASSGTEYVLSDILDTRPAQKLKSASSGKIYEPSDAIYKFPLNYQKYYNVLVDDGRVRRFSVQESKLIMGFPKDFYMPVPDTHAYRMLGRATWPPAIAGITREFAEWA